jgi:hypothetical protein
VASIAPLTTPSGRGVSTHLGPTALYPEASMTPGAYDTLDVNDLTRQWTENCPRHRSSCTYSQAHRNVPPEVHKLVYDEYNVPQPDRNIKHGEVDHFWPLCAGGSNDAKNLWYQPMENEWNGENLGYKQKDWLEDDICKQIKAGTLDPADAYKRLTDDWVKYYHDEMNRQQTRVQDPDDTAGQDDNNE